jgi:adenine-specific DNA-methyltransferase
LKSIYQLKENGRIAYIIPSEFLNSDYGKKIKEYLIKSNLLRHIIVFDFKENVFKNAQTTSSILLLAKDEFQENIHFSVVSNVRELSNIKEIINKYPKSFGQISISTKQIDPNIKWRKYYQKQQNKKYKNLIPFNQVAKVVRGIATGANEYFIFNVEKAKRYNIKEENLLPCITKSKDVNKPFFTKSDFTVLKNQNAKIFLFDGIKNQDENILKYIKLGEEQGIHKKYLTSKRNPWYSLENRPPSPIWVGVFNRTGLKFVRNEAGISNLTTFHCVYPTNNLFNNINIDLFFAYLLTDIAQQIFNDNRREYGDGLKKFEPNDLNNALMLDLSILDRKTQEYIIKLYNRYRNSVLKNNENKSIIDEINEILGKKYET